MAAELRQAAGQMQPQSSAGQEGALVPRIPHAVSVGSEEAGTGTEAEARGRTELCRKHRRGKTGQ